MALIKVPLSDKEKAKLDRMAKAEGVSAETMIAILLERGEPAPEGKKNCRDAVASQKSPASPSCQKNLRRGDNHLARRPA